MPMDTIYQMQLKVLKQILAELKKLNKKSRGCHKSTAGEDSSFFYDAELPDLMLCAD